MITNGKTLNILNFLCNSLQSCKKLNIFIHKKCINIDKCFTTHNNLGYLSDIHFDTFEEASINYSIVDYSNPVYTTSHEGFVYLSYDNFYNPIISRRIARQETDNFVIYRYLVVDNKGKLLKSILISKTDKKCNNE